MPNAAKGSIALVLENTSAPGIVPILAASNVGSLSATNQPTGSTGMRLLVYIYNNSATGTVAITGTDINGNAITDTSPTVPIMPIGGQSSFVSKWEYLTAKVFKTIGASGIVVTGCTSGTIVVQGIQAPKYLIPAVLKTKAKYDKYSPNEHRALMDMDTRRVQLVKKVSIDEIATALYPENSLWIGYMLTGATPTVTTLPASPTVLKAATAVGTMSLTSQPTFPGMILQLIIAGSSAVGSVAITGTDQFGNAASETVTTGGNGTNGNGTYYSTLVYSAVGVSGIVVTGDTTGTLAVNGIFGSKYVFAPQDAPYTANIEAFTGVDSFCMPYSAVDTIDIEMGTEKELKVTMKGIAQDRLVIGDRTTLGLATSRVVSLGQPADLPIVGWNCLFYIDTSPASIPTTQFIDLLDAKLSFKFPVSGGWTATNTQNYNRIYRKKRSCDWSATFDLTDVRQLEQYRLNTLLYATLQFLGAYIGGAAGSNQKMWQWTFAASYDNFEVDSTPDAERVTAKVAATAQYDTGLGSSYLLTVIDQSAPTYTA